MNAHIVSHAAIYWLNWGGALHDESENASEGGLIIILPTETHLKQLDD